MIKVQASLLSTIVWLYAILCTIPWTCSFDVSDGVLSPETQSCSWEDRETCASVGVQYRDPHLEPMVVDFGDHQETVDVYMLPDVSTFYPNATDDDRPIKKLETSFRGQFGKFINMSPNTVRVFWLSNTGDKQYIADLAPFGAAGTATYPNHKFIVTERNNADNILQRWTIKEFNCLYKYDPYGSLDKAKQELKSGEFKLYKLQHDNLAFDKSYRYKTGRQWLALYGRKHKPKFPMWPADYFGQTYQVSTKETHFISQPPDELAKAQLSSSPTARDLEIREKLQQYRSTDENLILNMTVLSVAPRVFEIRDFLSTEEVTHILELAMGITLERSTTKATSSATSQEAPSDTTRTSENSWISRHRTAVVDTIYRRAADLLQIPEACFRTRKEPHEVDLIANSTGPITERLQLVHYGVGQQYTPHHDFSVPDLRENQPSRFATLLLYLNEGMKGGETSFPRWLNGETSEVLEVTPEVGKAVLFYNVLPDGNYDERSQHAAKPVIEGEKWLTNLWVWDPYMY